MRWFVVGMSIAWLPIQDVAAQQGTGSITGRVTATSTATPLAGATVEVVGTQLRAVAGEDGRYLIPRVQAGRYELRATRIGYAPATSSVVVTTGPATADFTLRPHAVALDQVVVVGYGTQLQRDITGAVGSVKMEELEQAQVPTVGQALQGRVAGVQVTQASSQPGGGVNIRIRGSGSLSSTNEPLYVIDGVPISGGDNNDPIGGRDRVATNPLAFLNPEDIESLEVLKDASSTAIYGARGTNGVVLITTKKGRPGTSRIEFESSVSTQQVTKRIPLLNAQQFAELSNEWARLRGRGEAIPFPDGAAFGAGTDWQDQVLQQAPIQEHQVSVLGGTEQTRFSLSGNFLDQEGIVRGTEFERFSLRANVSHQAKSWLTLGSNVNVSRMYSSIGYAAGGQGGAAPSIINSALISLPILPVRKENGEYTLTDVDIPASLASLGIRPGSTENPVAGINETTDQSKYDRALGNLFAEFDLVEGMTLRLNGGADLVNNSRDEYFSRFTRRGGLGANGVAQSGVIERSHYLAESILSYTRAFGTLHNLNATTGFTYETDEQFQRFIGNRNFANDITKFYDIGAGTPEGGPSVSSGLRDWTLASYLGRVNYTLADRYLFTLTGRADGSSKFGADHKWGFFPSGALAWRLSEEPFLRGAEWLSDLKLRVSYGVTGNQEIGTYQSLARIGNTSYNFGGTPVSGYRFNSIANPDLRWERSRQFDAGFDVGLFGSRVSLTADYYNKLTDDLLLQVPLPFESGFASALVNLGSIRNRGVELALSANLLDRSENGFGWRTSVNYTANRNRVLSIGAADQITGQSISNDLRIGGLLVRPGEPIGSFFGYRNDGIFRSEAEVAAHVGPEGLPIQPGAVPGQLRIRDVDGDGRITAGDRTILGNPEPDFTFGWTNELSYGPFNLYAFVQGSQGNEVFNLGLRQIARANVEPTVNVYAPRWFDRWTPENPDAKWPVLTLPDNVGYRGVGAFSDEAFFVEDGSYVRLRSVTLSYDMPARVASRVGGMQNARVFVNGENLVTWTGYSGFNPDVNTAGQDNINRGIDFAGYPLARVYRIGVRFGL